MADQEVPWAQGNRSEIFNELLQKSITHSPTNKSSINWGGIPDSLVQKMKE